MKTFEFEITIQRKLDGYWPIVVKVKHPDGLPTQTEGRFQLSEDDFQELTAAQGNEKQYGTLLGKALFRDDVERTFIRNLSKSSQDCPLRIMLSNETDDEDELRKLYWERLCAPIDADGTWNLLARDQRVPYSQYISTINDRPFPPIGRSDLRALVLVASPSNLGKYQLDPFDVEAAVSSVRKALGEIPCAVLANNIEGAIGPPTLEELSKQLTNAQEPYTLLHFVCHGMLSQDGETALFWATEDNQLKQVTGTQLLEEIGCIGGQRNLPHFAFLCTCESAAPRAEGALGGLAQRLVRNLGMPAVVGMTRKVSVQTALALGQNFYQRLRASGAVDVALQEATAGLGNRPDITVPALFSRLGGTPLFSATDETIGKQYEGYETEAEVRKVVGEYTLQPLAGRSKEQETINQFLAQNASGVLLLTAPAGFGKSSLLMHWQQTKQEDYFIAFHCFRTSSSVLRSVPNAYRHLLRQLYVYYNRRDQQFPSDLRSQIKGLIDDAKAQSDKPLVIVLDGLDEAQETFEPFLSSPLPDGVFIIASARAEEGDEPEYLQGWTTNAQRLHLKRLPREAISDWVASVDSRLARYAQDNSFIEKLNEVTIGFPLYLRYLLDDLKQAVDKGNDVKALLTNSPM
ncbi:MAG TPA: CHAT domain-containing protein, partial [Methylococcales bacterium]